MSKVVTTLSVALLTAVTVWTVASWSAAAREMDHPRQAPEFSHSAPRDWLNAAAMTLEDLRGRVVLIDFWSYGCWNCYRSFPWLNDLEDRFGPRGLIVVGVHSPEFEHEKNRSKVAAKVQEFEIAHPVMIDNDLSYWKAMENRYWPTFYLIDRVGQIRASYIGETHSGDRNARAIEDKVSELLSESAPS